MGRKLSPVTERRRARKAAREVCKAEGKRVKAWAPSERKRVAGVVAQLRAEGQQQITQVRAQTAERIREERLQLGKRIKDARAAAKLGKCVDMTAGPRIAMYSHPKKPQHLRKKVGTGVSARGGQRRMFSSAPLYSGGKVGAPYRVRGELLANEKAALAAVARHLKADQGGIVVLEHSDGAGGYNDGPYYGLDELKRGQIRELDPLDPHGHSVGRATKMGARPPRSVPPRKPSTRPPAPKKKSAAPPSRDPIGARLGSETGESASLKIRGETYDVGRIYELDNGNFELRDRDGETLATRDYRSHEWKRGGAVVKVDTFARDIVGPSTPPKLTGKAIGVAARRAYRNDFRDRLERAGANSMLSRTAVEPDHDTGMAAVAKHARASPVEHVLGRPKKRKAKPAPGRAHIAVGARVRVPYLLRTIVGSLPANTPATIREIRSHDGRARIEDDQGREWWAEIAALEAAPAKRASSKPPPLPPPLDDADRKSLKMIGDTLRQRDGRTDNPNIAHHRMVNYRGALKPMQKWLGLDDYDLAAALALQGPATLEAARDALRAELRWEAERAVPLHKRR